MRHFAHHIGDYAAATGHLSFVEDAAYCRLLRRYYQDEKPLPHDLITLQRLTGARTEDERAAVETILREFFVLGDDGFWHQSRADKEVAIYQSRSGAARANGRLGGRPKTNREPANDPTDNQVGYVRDSQEEPDGEPTETLTMNHEPRTKKDNNAPKRSVESRGTRIPNDWQPTADDCAFARNLGLDPKSLRDEFVDYWATIPGARGRKLDWSKTWRNRCRDKGKGKATTGKLDFN